MSWRGTYRDRHTKDCLAVSFNQSSGHSRHFQATVGNPESKILKGHELTSAGKGLRTIIVYIGFFNTGAYQESIGGFGGLQHCLIPHPKHLLIDRNEKGELTYRIFKEQQKSSELLSILGYENNSDLTHKETKKLIKENVLK